MNDTQTVIPPARPQRSTMIKNLMPRLPERGHIKIGELGETKKAQSGREYQIPRKLSAFRVTTLERGSDGNFLRNEEIHERLGDEPTEIPIRLLFDQVDLNFPTRYSVYIGKTLWCSGDGETALRASKQPQDAPLPEPFTVQCPCHRQAPGYNQKDKCKINGRLSVLLEGMGGIGGVFVFRTTSFNSVTGLLSSLAFLRSVTGGILANIPLKLRIQPKQATNPTDQSSVLIYVVSVEFAGDVAELQQMAHQIALDRATTHMSIEHIEEEARRNLALPGPENAVLPGDVPDDVIAEFFPEQLAETGEIPPRPTRAEFVEHLEGDREGNDTTTAEISPALPEDAEPVNYDPETGEIIEPEADIELLSAAIDAAQGGVATFRAFWAKLSIDQRAVINPDRAKYQEIAEKADAAAPAAPPVQGKAPEATKAPPKAKAAPSAPQTPQTVEPVPHGTSERADFWDDPKASWTIEAPKAANGGVNSQTLRDKLMFFVDQARTITEITRFENENEAHLRLLDTHAAPYAKMVRERIEAVREKL